MEWGQPSTPRSVGAVSFHAGNPQECLCDVTEGNTRFLDGEGETRLPLGSTEIIQRHRQVRGSELNPGDEDMVNEAFDVVRTMRLSREKGRVSALESEPQDRAYDHIHLLNAQQRTDSVFFPHEYFVTRAVSPISVQSTDLAPLRRLGGAASYGVSGDLCSRRPSAFLSHVFVPSLWPLILSVANLLKDNGINVCLDTHESVGISPRGIDWYNKCIEECDFVIVCANASYKHKLEQCKPGRVQTVEDQGVVGAVFVHNQLQTKYVNDGCFNFKVLPLIIDDAPCSCLPLWLQNTIIYRWPKDKERLIRRIYRS